MRVLALKLGIWVLMLVGNDLIRVLALFPTFLAGFRTLNASEWSSQLGHGTCPRVPTRPLLIRPPVFPFRQTIRHSLDHAK